MQKLIAFSALLALTVALPQRNRGGRKQQTAQQQATQVAQGISQAQDGSTILDDTVMVNGLPIRFKISAPADQFLPASGVPGAAATSSNGTLGANVLLHGDGGQSFFDMPNQNVQANTMGVALLAPDPNLFWGGGSGLQRTDGVEHAQAVNDFIQNELPLRVAVDMSNVVFTGVSGGSLLMSGFFIPAQMQNYANSAVELNCGGMPPQVAFQNAATVMSQTRIHYQSTQSELQLLQDSIPQAVAAYEQLAADAGLSATQINQLQTVDNTPAGGHCEFDGQDFVSGVQTMLTSFSNVMQGGNGAVQGLGAPSNGVVTNGVVGNENLQFVAGRKREVAEEGMVKVRWAQEVAEEPEFNFLICDRATCE
ncbi:Nn.00g010260.m01.CDS01 [Neocucurbitaria sp. VM-36]